MTSYIKDSRPKNKYEILRKDEVVLCVLAITGQRALDSAYKALYPMRALRYRRLREVDALDSSAKLQIVLDNTTKIYAITALSTAGHALVYKSGEWYFADDSEFSLLDYLTVFNNPASARSQFGYLMQRDSEFWGRNLFDYRTRLPEDPEHCTVIKESCKLVAIGARCTVI